MPGKYKKHTPIVSNAQRRFFGAAISKPSIAPGLDKKEIVSHLKESKGKKLPARTTPKKVSTSEMRARKLLKGRV